MPSSETEPTTLGLLTCALIHWIAPPLVQILSIKCFFLGHHSALCPVWALNWQLYDHYFTLKQIVPLILLVCFRVAGREPFSRDQTRFERRSLRKPQFSETTKNLTKSNPVRNSLGKGNIKRKPSTENNHAQSNHDPSSVTGYACNDIVMICCFVTLHIILLQMTSSNCVHISQTPLAFFWSECQE